MSEAAPLPICWVCGSRPADTAEHKIKASDVRIVAPRLSAANPAYLQINSVATNKAIASTTSKALAFPTSICGYCNNTGTQPYDDAWRRLSKYLHANWRDIVGRGSFDLTRVFGTDSAAQALNVHLYFVKLLGCKLNAEKIRVDLSSLSAALVARVPHPEITVLVAKL